MTASLAREPVRFAKSRKGETAQLGMPLGNSLVTKMASLLTTLFVTRGICKSDVLNPGTLYLDVKH